MLEAKFEKIWAQILQLSMSFDSWTSEAEECPESPTEEVAANEAVFRPVEGFSIKSSPLKPFAKKAL